MIETWVTKTQRLHKTPSPVVQVQRQTHLRDEVNAHDPWHVKTRNHIAVDIGLAIFARDSLSKCQVRDVVDDV